jgi:4-diphosphocytidyl-2-C-methyl-D-erythritol kinase
MIVFPNAKINLGLQVVSRRGDGFHDIATVFYPVTWCDALEIIIAENRQPFSLTQSGILISSDIESNIVYKAWQAVSKIKRLPSLQVHLHKHIPMGAGLGGGSSDAAAFITAVNKLLHLGITNEEQMQIASSLGSDCAFFIHNKPVLASGRGDQFKSVTIDLSSYFILLVYPGIHSSTADAYRLVKPARPEKDPEHVLRLPINEWKNNLVNDFESSIFNKFPQVKELKQLLYDSGALYASMSGSGSAVFGLFDSAPEVKFPETMRWHLQKPGTKF